MGRLPVTVRRAEPGDLPWMLDRAAGEGWNPGLGDAAPFLAADPDGFLIAEAGGERVGCLSAVAYGPAYGFVGFYIVLPEERGKRYGIAMWDVAMAALGDRVLGLDGVIEQQDNYRRSGFELAYRQVRHSGRAVGGGPGTSLPLSAVPFEAVLAFDTAHVAAPRERFLAPWLAQPGVIARAAVEGGQLRGYGVLRPCRTGYKVGPLFAATPSIAEGLLGDLCTAIEGQDVAFDTPEANADAVALARQAGLVPVFETARMYRGAEPRFPVHEVFGVTSFELG